MMTEKIIQKIIKSIGSTGSLIIHSIIFIIAFFLYFSEIFDKNTILLILTTIVSLEAIYLSILIQMSVNFQSKKFEEIKKDVEDIQENVEDIQKDVEDIQENVEDIQENVEEIQENVAEEDEEDDEYESALTEVRETLKKLLLNFDELKNKKKK